MRILLAAFSLVLAAAFMASAASATLDCAVCSPGSCPFQGVNLFNLSNDGSVFSGPNDLEVRCRDTGGSVLSSSGTEKYNFTLIRATSMQGGHAERGDYSDYPFMINLSSNEVRIECGWIVGSCAGYDDCVVSLSGDKNAHVGECSWYNLKVCCGAADLAVPVCNAIWISPPERTPWTNQKFTVHWSCSDPSGISSYNVQVRITSYDGVQVFSDWSDWLTISSDSVEFTPTANNQTYHFRVNATDNSGNTGEYFGTANTTFDNEQPEISWSIDENGEIHSSAWDGVSGISNHTIECEIVNPEGSLFVQCPSPLAPFGEVSICSSPMSYTENTEISCTIRAEDRAGNFLEEGFIFSENPEHPLAEFLVRSTFIIIGEGQHVKVRVKNFNSSSDIVNISLGGTYPQDFAKFMDSSALSWISPDRRSISVPMKPYEQKIIYVEMVSTDAGEYDLTLDAESQNFAVSDYDETEITVGFHAAFTGIETFSVLAIIAVSAFAYWKIRKKGFPGSAASA